MESNETNQWRQVELSLLIELSGWNGWFQLALQSIDFINWINGQWVIGFRSAALHSISLNSLLISLCLLFLHCLPSKIFTCLIPSLQTLHFSISFQLINKEERYNKLKEEWKYEIDWSGRMETKPITINPLLMNEMN